jgi:hypothetical protein
MIILAAESFRAVEGSFHPFCFGGNRNSDSKRESPTNATADAVYSLINKEFANEDD